MSDEPLGLSIFPRRWIPGALPPPAYVLVYLNWLQHELDAQAEQKWPLLKHIHGWRRIEVIEFLENEPDWTIGILNTKL